MSAPYLHPDQPDRLPVVHIDVSVDAFRGRVESFAQRQGGQITVRDEVSS